MRVLLGVLLCWLAAGCASAAGWGGGVGSPVGGGGCWAGLPALPGPAGFDAPPETGFLAQYSGYDGDAPVDASGGGKDFTRSGFYFGAAAQAGASSVSYKDSQPESGSSSGGWFFAGYRINPGIGVEAFFDRRSTSVSDSGSSGKVDFDVDGRAYGVQARLYLAEAFAKDRGQGAAGRASNPIQPFAIFGIGAGETNSKAKLSGSVSGTLDIDESAVFLRFGIGCEFCLTRNLAAFVEGDLVVLGGGDVSVTTGDIVGGILVRF